MWIFALVAIGSFASSFAAKLIADAFLTERIPVLGSFAGLTLTHNPGIAFGVRLPTGYQELIILIALLLVCVVAVKSPKTYVNGWGYGLIVGGALGNVVDRFQDSVVTDFFQIGTFPVFNVADSCITVGVILLLAHSVFLGRSHAS